MPLHIKKQAERRPRVFYGWYIIATCMLSAVLAAGTSQLFMSLMLKPITEEFGWSRTTTTGAITAGTIAAGLLSPFVGRLTDRFGPRLLMTAGALAVAGVYLGLSRLAELWQFYLAYLVGRAIGATSLSGVTPMTAAANWFRRRRGRAIGLISMSLPLGSAALSLVGQYIIDGYGWRTVFVVFALATAGLLVAPAALVMRRRPEDMGLLPDGAATRATTEETVEQRAAGEEPVWTLREAVRTPTLWYLIGAISLAVMANTAVGFHQVAYYTDHGIPPAAAAMVLSVYAFAGAFASGIWGFLTERFSERYLAVASMLLCAGAITFQLFVRSTAAALVFAVWFGITSRGEGPLVNIMLAQYYGRRSYGAISGFVGPFQMVGLGLGPLIASIAFDLTGSYSGVFVVFVGVALLAAVLLWLARQPDRPLARPVEAAELA